MQTKVNTSWQEEQALNRYQLIAPLLDESMDDAKRIQLRKEIAQRNEISRAACTAMNPLIEKADLRD